MNIHAICLRNQKKYKSLHFFFVIILNDSKHDTSRHPKQICVTDRLRNLPPPTLNKRVCFLPSQSYLAYLVLYCFFPGFDVYSKAYPHPLWQNYCIYKSPTISAANIKYNIHEQNDDQVAIQYCLVTCQTPARSVSIIPFYSAILYL